MLCLQARLLQSGLNSSSLLLPTFVDAIRSALQQKAWQTSQPAQPSGLSQADNQRPPSTTTVPEASSSNNALDASLVDRQLVNMLMQMGFSEHRAAKAALETGNTGPSHCPNACRHLHCIPAPQMQLEQCPHQTASKHACTILQSGSRLHHNVI